MKDQLAQINRTVVGLLLVLVLGAGGFLWWQFMYKPAVVTRDAAQASASSAQATLDDARGRLAAAQQQVDEAKKQSGGVLDDSIARLQLAQEAITPKPFIDDAALVLTRFADRSGISTAIELDSPEAGSTTAAAGSNATPVTIKLAAAGSYAELQHFIALVEGSVEVKRGEMHVRGRLFNVVGVEMRPPDSQPGSTTDGTTSGDASGDASAASALKVGKNDIVYDIQIRMYTSTFGGDAAAAAGTTPGATATTPGATNPDGTPATPAAGTPGATTTTDPNAAAGGATGSTATPGAPGATPGATTTTPGATGTTPGATSTTTPTPGATG